MIVKQSQLVFQCLSLLLLMVVTELAGTTLVYKKQHVLGQALSSYMAHSMHVTSVDYGLNVSDTQLWDEIQMEV